MTHRYLITHASQFPHSISVAIWTLIPSIGDRHNSTIHALPNHSSPPLTPLGLASRPSERHTVTLSQYEEDAISRTIWANTVSG